MSADRQRLTSAIRRIAKTDPEIRGLLKAADNKGGKPGSAGVGSSTDAESQRICCDGSTSGSANPGTEERDPDSSTQSGLDSTDPADLTSGESTLSGVTDCATGEPICFDGAGFVPPDGWDEPQDPPYIEGYEPGFYWVESSTSGVPNLTADMVCDELTGFDGYAINCSETSCTCTSDETGPFNSTKRLECGGSTADYCNPSENEIRATRWPSDSCVNLAIINGTIVGSKYDPENDGSYSAPRDSIDLCSGTDQISLAPAANGGWKTINSTTNNGYLYDSSGEKIAHIDGNEYSDPSV